MAKNQCLKCLNYKTLFKRKTSKIWWVTAM